ncbi:DUF7663 domain-containing protein [Butyrivibrio sp. NC2002]|uniref:DUF7663 domain-containing protein n=1 Tax=Butyrivibrio sp. NC2002 TaxID=1410610 RepID=UPI000566AB7B|nr:hypothetical protein [Butyrivibrio sp. NC2002]
MKSVDEIIKSHKRICWYPSAGADFRELLFLSPKYLKWKSVSISKKELPDLFILTDCFPHDCSFKRTPSPSYIERLNHDNYSDLNTIVHDSRTRITVNDKIEEISFSGIPFDEIFFNFDISDNYNKAFLMNLHIDSDKLGEWDSEVLYILVENTRFALDYLYKNKIHIDWIIKVRYGDAFGGSTLSGDWLLKLLGPLNVKYYLSNKVTESSFEYIPESIIKEYPIHKEILNDTSLQNLEEVHRVDAVTWSDQGDIYWYRVLH